MGEYTRVLIYGASIVLDGIAASLLNEERLEVVRLPQPLLHLNDVEALAPNVIVFDTETPGSAAVFSALENHPNLLLLGVTPDKNVVRLWSGREHRELSIPDLVALIQADSSRAAVASDVSEPRQGGARR
jgi:hypothetical protein